MSTPYDETAGAAPDQVADGRAVTPPDLSETQWLALAEAAAAVQDAQAALDRAQAQWRLVSLATGIEGAWTFNLDTRTITPA